MIIRYRKRRFFYMSMQSAFGQGLALSATVVGVVAISNIVSSYFLGGVTLEEKITERFGELA